MGCNVMIKMIFRINSGLDDDSTRRHNCLGFICEDKWLPKWISSSCSLIRGSILIIRKQISYTAVNSFHPLPNRLSNKPCRPTPAFFVLVVYQYGRWRGSSYIPQRTLCFASLFIPSRVSFNVRLLPPLLVCLRGGCRYYMLKRGKGYNCDYIYVDRLGLYRDIGGEQNKRQIVRIVQEGKLPKQILRR